MKLRAPSWEKKVENFSISLGCEECLVTQKILNKIWHLPCKFKLVLFCSVSICSFFSKWPKEEWFVPSSPSPPTIFPDFFLTGNLGVPICCKSGLATLPQQAYEKNQINRGKQGERKMYLMCSHWEGRPEIQQTSQVHHWGPEVRPKFK